jgi:hypothetical protein
MEARILMQQTTLNRKIITAVLCFLEHPRHITSLYRTMENDHRVYRGGDRRYLREDFEAFLFQLEAEGTAIAQENADIIAAKLLGRFNKIIHRRCIDQWRRGTFPAA